MPSHTCLTSRLARGFPCSPVTRRTLSSRTAFARSLVSAGTASTGAGGAATAAVATRSQFPLACVLPVPTMASRTVALTAHLDRRWERSLSTRVLSVTACTCCAPARHLLVSVSSRRRGAETLLHREQKRGRSVDRHLGGLPQVYAASMLAVSPRACGARYTARQQERGLSVRDSYRWYAGPKRHDRHLVCISRPKVGLSFRKFGERIAGGSGRKFRNGSHQKPPTTKAASQVLVVAFFAATRCAHSHSHSPSSEASLLRRRHRAPTRPDVSSAPRSRELAPSWTRVWLLLLPVSGATEPCCCRARQSSASSKSCPSGPARPRSGRSSPDRNSARLRNAQRARQSVGRTLVLPARGTAVRWGQPPGRSRAALGPLHGLGLGLARTGADPSGEHLPLVVPVVEAELAAEVALLTKLAVVVVAARVGVVRVAVVAEAVERHRVAELGRQRDSHEACARLGLGLGLGSG